MKLNLGCGGNYLSGYINVDNNPNIKRIDVFYDLEKVPYPFRNSSVEEILMDHVIEHLHDTIGIILELYRISADGAFITIKAPHFSCNWTHPGHKKAVGCGLFDHFKKSHVEHYGNCDFTVIRKRLHWIRPCYIDSLLKRIANAIISWLANLNLRFCERVWCYWVGGFEEIEFRVKVNKEIG